MTDERFAELQAKLERDFPGINDPTNERFYVARLTGNQMKQLIEMDRMKLRAKFDPPA